jgi:CPA1 family monovalent cation:H+ antiporter
MTGVSTLVILYCIATAVAIAARRLRVPYTVALVVIGLALGSGHFLAAPDLTRELLFTIFLPGLLFEAAFHLDLKAFRQVWKSAVALAVPGVVIGIAITALLVIACARAVGSSAAVGLSTALIFGGVVAATDPVAVTALFRELRVPSRLAVLIESESLFNDGTGVVLFTLIVGYATGQSFSITSGVLQFLLIAGGGVVIGLAIGSLISAVIHRIDESVIEIGLTVIAAYGSFVLAEHLHVSGVLATVVAGMLCGRDGRGHSAPDIPRAAVESFWQYIAFALNSIVFLLIGFEFDELRVGPTWVMVLGGFAAMLIARAVVVGMLLAAGPLTRENVPGRWGVPLIFGGLRGALSIVLALALPASLPSRDLLVSMTVGVALLSIIGQGLSMPAIISGLGIGERSSQRAH